MNKEDYAKLNSYINEDEIIKKIQLDFPSLYDDLEYNEYTIKEKLEKNPYLYQQFRLLTIKEKHRLKRIEIIMDEYIGKLYDSLRYGEKALTKVEIEKYYIPKDENVIKFKKMYMRQYIIADTYETITDAFKQQNFGMNVYVKNLNTV